MQNYSERSKQWPSKSIADQTYANALLGGGANEVFDYRITVDFFENYRNTVIEFLYNYRHRSIFY